MTAAASLSLRLVRPATEYRESFLAGLRELRAEGLPWYLELDEKAIAADFETYVGTEQGILRPGRVPETVFWAVLGGEFAGKIGVRHELTPELKRVGGHIGYDTVPRFRRRGIASFMLREILPQARGVVGLSEVLLTCDDTNAASIRVIEKNGGKLTELRELEPGRPFKRYYWIKLRASDTLSP